jgi:hypothetical protein
MTGDNWLFAISIAWGVVLVAAILIVAFVH